MMIDVYWPPIQFRGVLMSGRQAVFVCHAYASTKTCQLSITYNFQGKWLYVKLFNVKTSNEIKRQRNNVNQQSHKLVKR